MIADEDQGQGKWTGKFSRAQQKPSDASRGVTMSEKDFTIAEEVLKIASETKRTPSQVAINWSVNRRGPRSPPPIPLIGARFAI